MRIFVLMYCLWLTGVPVYGQSVPSPQVHDGESLRFDSLPIKDKGMRLSALIQKLVPHWHGWAIEGGVDAWRHEGKQKGDTHSQHRHRDSTLPSAYQRLTQCLSDLYQTSLKKARREGGDFAQNRAKAEREFVHHVRDENNVEYSEYRRWIQSIMLHAAKAFAPEARQPPSRGSMSLGTVQSRIEKYVPEIVAHTYQGRDVKGSGAQRLAPTHEKSTRLYSAKVSPTGNVSERADGLGQRNRPGESEYADLHRTAQVQRTQIDQLKHVNTAIKKTNTDLVQQLKKANNALAQKAKAPVSSQQTQKQGSSAAVATQTDSQSPHIVIKKEKDLKAQKDVAKLTEALKTLKGKHAQELKAQQAAHAQEKADLQKQHDQEKKDLQKKHAQEKAELQVELMQELQNNLVLLNQSDPDALIHPNKPNQDLQDEVSKLTRQIDSLKSQILYHENEKKIMQVDFEKWKQDYSEEAQDELNELNAHYTDELAALEELIIHHETENATLKEEITHLNNRLDSLSQFEEDFLEKEKQLESGLEIKSKKIEELTRILCIVRQQQQYEDQEMQQKLFQAQKTNEICRLQYEELKVHWLHMQNQNKNLVQDNQAYARRHDDINNALNEKIFKIAALTQQQEKWETQMNDKDKIIEKLLYDQGFVKNVQNQIFTLKEQNGNLRKENEDLKGQLTETQAKLHEAVTEGLNVYNQLQTLQFQTLQLQTLNKDHEELKQDLAKQKDDQSAYDSARTASTYHSNDD